MMIPANRISILLTLLAFIGSPTALSQIQSTGSSVITHGQQSAPLQGGVEKVELDLEKLRQVGTDLKEVSKAASTLYDQVTIQPVVMVMQPQQVGFGTIINVPVGTRPIGPPPAASKKQVDLAINRMAPIINLLKKNVDDFVAGQKEFDLSENAMAKLEPKFQDWVNTVNRIAFQQKQLERIAQNPPYDNDAIAYLTQSIQKDVKSLEKTRVAINKIVVKEGKRDVALKNRNG